MKQVGLLYMAVTILVALGTGVLIGDLIFSGDTVVYQENNCSSYVEDVNNLAAENNACTLQVEAYESQISKYENLTCDLQRFLIPFNDSKVRVWKPSPTELRIEYSNGLYAIGTKDGGTVNILCDSHSMLPSFNCTDYLILYRPSEEEVKIGSIIDYKKNMEMVPYITNSELTSVIHRVIDIREDENGTYYVTKGDNNPYEDPWKVRFEDILWMVVNVVPK